MYVSSAEKIYPLHRKKRTTRKLSKGKTHPVKNKTKIETYIEFVMFLTFKVSSFDWEVKKEWGEEKIK